MEDSPANEWLQDSRFISLSSETLVLLTTVNVTDFPEECEQHGVPEDGKEICVYLL